MSFTEKFGIKKLKELKKTTIFKITVVYFICVFLPISLFFCIGFFKIGQIIEEDNRTSVDSSLLSFEQSLWKQIYHYDGVISSIAKSEYAADCFDGDKGSAERLSDFVDEFITGQGETYKDISFYLYNADIKAPCIKTVRSAQEEPWFDSFYSSGSAELWIPRLYGSEKTLMKCVKLYDRRQQEAGLLSVSVDLQQIILSSVQLLGDKQRLFVLSENAEFLWRDTGFEYAEEISGAVSSLDKQTARLRHGGEYTVKGKSITVAMKSVPELRIILGSSVPENENSGGYAVFKYIIGFMLLMLTVFLSVFYYYIIRIFTTVRGDISRVKYLVDNDISGRLQIRYDDEIGDIERQYNQLLEKIEGLTKNIMLKERLRKNAEIAMLQSQLNPHFIYNVINYFRMEAEIKEDYAMADSIAKFGKLMRYNMMNRNYITTLKDELSNLKYYLELELLRFPGRIRYTIECPVGYDDVRVPKFIFQPIVENSVKYAKTNGEVIKIAISVTPRDKDIYITLRDDGRGVDKRTLQSLNAQFESGYYKQSAEGAASTKVGLKNINQRLRLIYDDSYHLTVSSEENKYFEVCIRIPME